MLHCHTRRLLHERDRKKRFFLKNMWLTDPNWPDVISTAWSSVSHQDVVDNLTLKTKRCSEKFIKCNEDIFGYVGKVMWNLEMQLWVLQDAISRWHNLGKISEWHRRFYVGQTTWNKITKLLGGSIHIQSCRKLEITLNSFDDDNGVWYDPIDDIEKLTVNYYADLFNTSNDLEMMDILGYVSRQVTSEMNDSSF